MFTDNPFRSLINIEVGKAKTILKYRFRTNKCQKRLEMGKFSSLVVTKILIIKKTSEKSEINTNIFSGFFANGDIYLLSKFSLCQDLLS